MSALGGNVGLFKADWIADPDLLAQRRALEARARLTRPPALFQLIDLLVIGDRRHADLLCRIAVVEQG